MFGFARLSTGKPQSIIGQIKTVDHECHYPFNPSSIITIIIFQKKGTDYISQGEERCAWHFAKEIETTVRDSVVLPDYFKNKILKEVEETKKKKKSI